MQLPDHRAGYSDFCRFYFAGTGKLSRAIFFLLGDLFSDGFILADFVLWRHQGNFVSLLWKTPQRCNAAENTFKK